MRVLRFSPVLRMRVDIYLKKTKTTKTDKPQFYAQSYNWLVILDMGKRCSIVFFVIFLVTASILSTVECNAAGPPGAACAPLSPLQSAHLNAPAQTVPVPYTVDLSALSDGNGGFSYEPGMTYTREYRATSLSIQWNL